MSTLSSRLQDLADKFAADLVHAVRSASLAEILGATGGLASSKPAAKAAAKAAPKAAAPRAARSAVTVDAIVNVLRQHKNGLRSEHLRKALGAKRGAWRYQMQKAISEKRVRMTGTKNSAVYFAR